ncbi:hypothetical protein FK220_008175 [Flavobacteriaceae bacterium TP-CH-4]|uniref:Uncharacterized protein n=1 Tax=Pelagihabitans pacificus TaxID=2696054 RepID=A0A967EDG6_9FLAO|nr:hypothetical protein [Pelagihabitans pacificus]NHF59313.1 hypothetical protein [Pelagihabitans pacificus]
MDKELTDYGAFQDSLGFDRPRPTWPEALKALWYDAKGDWGASHNIAQEIYSDLGSWIHAYLHRKEGDGFNAGYWYRRAGRPFPKISLDEEHRQIFEDVLGNQ